MKLYLLHHFANFASRKGFIAFSALRLFGPTCQNAEQTAVRAKQVKEWEEMTEKWKITSLNLTFTSKSKTKNDLISQIIYCIKVHSVPFLKDLISEQLITGTQCTEKKSNFFPELKFEIKEF